MILPEPFIPSGDGSFEAPVFGILPYDPKTSQHPFDGLCKVCDAPLDQLWRSMDQKAEDGRWLRRGYAPVNCCEPCYERAKLGDHAEANMAAWNARCPIEFRKPFSDTLGNNQVLVKVLAFNPRGGRGMVIHGATSTGKTRCAWALAKRLTEDSIRWLFLESVDYLDSLPSDALTVPILFLDDLGNDTLRGDREVRLLKLIRTRCQWHRPIVVTSQFSGEALCARFSEDATAQAIVRRLREFCDSVHAK